MKELGSSQNKRYINALNPSYYSIDERGYEHYLEFLRRYSSMIRYYDKDVDGSGNAKKDVKYDWSCFYEENIAVIAASIMLYDIEKVKARYDVRRRMLESHINGIRFLGLVKIVLEIAHEIDKWYVLSEPETPIHKDIEIAIKSVLGKELRRVLRAIDEFKYFAPELYLKINIPKIVGSAWMLDDKLDEENSIYEGFSVNEKIKNAAISLDSMFLVFYGFVKSLVDEKSVVYMRYAFEKCSSHKPHVALYIAFIEMMMVYRKKIDGMTGRILDFYYREVLNLVPKISVPDRVYVSFTIAKDVTDYSIEKGTMLKAGKDISGKEQYYETSDSIVVNTSKIKELKSVFVKKQKNEEDDKKIILAVYARPIANSKDGFGEKITDPSGKWPTFGVESELSCVVYDDDIEKKNKIARRDSVKIGLAISSPQILMREGNRLLKWKINGLKKIIKYYDDNDSDIEIYMTGESGWIKIEKNMTDENSESLFEKIRQVEESGSFKMMDIKQGYYYDYEQECLYVYLSKVCEGIVSYNRSIHEGYRYETKYPVIQMLFRPGINIVENGMCEIPELRHSIFVRVGSCSDGNNEQNKQYDGL